MGCKGDVILIYPCNHPRWPLLPNSVLALMNPLIRTGFSPKIVDTAVEDYKSIDYRGAICVGISALTDPSILRGIEVAGHIQAHYPGVPIVWGGHHPTILPAQTMASPAVDLLCRNEGEVSFPELAKRLAARQSPDGVPGITWKAEDGTVFHNPDQKLVDMDSVDLYPYHLLDLEKYPIIHERFSYQSSRGCPCHCRFCSFDVLKRWRPKSPQKMVDELQQIVETFRPQDIEMADDNFFVNRKRVEQFCEMAIAKGLSLRWSANCRFDYFSEYGDDFIKLLKESGCYLLCFGGESGSNRILDYLDKKLNREQILESVRKAERHHLRVQMSFMCGFPGETREDVWATLSLMDEIRRISPGAEINGFFPYTPYPGSILFEEVQRSGFSPPQSLEEWGRFDPNLEHTNRTTPWVSKKERQVLETIGSMVRFEYLLKKYREMSSIQKRAWFFNSTWMVKAFDFFCLFFRFSHWLRWKKKWFHVPWEWEAWAFLRDRFLGRV
jgi:anaerobic magnesium-protoporphyrin IX monomethyl ester cyclase